MTHNFPYGVFIQLGRLVVNDRRFSNRSDIDIYNNWLRENCIEYRCREGYLTKQHVLEPSYLRCFFVSFRDANEAAHFKLVFADNVVEFPEDGHFINCY